jgi:DNA-binding transcriptional MerR regulator
MVGALNPNCEKDERCANLCVMYTTEELATTFHTTPETIRQWAIQFKDHLKPTANPGQNRARQFTDDDMRTMTLIAELKARKLRPDEIKQAILSGEFREIPESASALGFADRGKIARLEDKVNELQLALGDVMKASSKKDGIIETLEHQLAEAQKEIRQLIGENAVLKSKLE